MWYHLVLHPKSLDISIQFLVERRTTRMVCGTSFEEPKKNTYLPAVLYAKLFLREIIYDFLSQRGIVYPVSLYNLPCYSSKAAFTVIH